MRERLERDRRRCVQDPEWQNPEWQDPEVCILQFGKIKKNATKNTSNQLNENRGNNMGPRVSRTPQHHLQQRSRSVSCYFSLVLRLAAGLAAVRIASKLPTAHRVACPGEMQRN